MKNLRVKEMFEQPSPKNSNSTLRKPSLWSPNWLVLEESRAMNWPLAEKASIAAPKDWSFVFSWNRMSSILAGELKLVHDRILQAPKVSSHGLHRQVSIRRGIAEPRNILKGCYHCLHLLIVLLIPPVYLYYK